MIDINRHAPVVGSAFTEIDAPPDVVWEILSDIEHWSQWNPDIASAKLEGPLAPGTRFTWKAGPGNITSVLAEVTPTELMAWKGKSFGVRAVHLWRLESNGQGTILRTDESMEGIPARLFRRSLEKTLQKALASGLSAAKKEAERRFHQQ